MSDELERRLQDAFDARARSAVGDGALPPAPRFESAPANGHGRLVRWVAPLAAAAAVVGVVTGVVAVGHSSGHGHSGTQAAASKTATQPAVTTSVHVKLLNDDGARYGVGMPVIAYFSQQITDARPLQRATVATVNGKPVQGAWYFERSAAGNGPIEGHFRLASYWPANATIEVRMPIKGLPAGGKLHYDDSLTTRFHTGSANIVTVDDKTHRLTVMANGKRVGSFPVSLGTPAEPTRPGIKVIMEKPGTVKLSGPGFHDLPVHYAQRLTYGGEYLIAAPWNAANIKAGVDSSNGCTNLLTANAKKLFSMLEIGDVVTFEHTDGPTMTIGSGYGDWNVPWSTWLTGGLVRTH
jgi:Uncharacterized protein conserved in bacteria